MSEPTPPDATPAKPASASKLPLIIAVVVAAAVAGGGAWTFAQKDAEKKIKAATAAAAKGRPAAAAAGAEGGAAAPEAEAGEEEEEGAASGGEGAKTVNLAPFLVNLGPDISDMHYLKVSIGVEVANEEAAHAFDEHSAKVRNNVLMYLSNLKTDEIQGAEAREKILLRLRTEVRRAVGAKNVRGVYLTEFVIQ